MATDLVVVGGGEHARVVIEAAQAARGVWNVVGFADPAPCEDTAGRLGLRRVGGDDDAIGLASRGASLVLAVGALGISDVRSRIVMRFPASIRWATIIHPAAWVSPTATVESGAVVLAGAMINSGAKVGPHAIVNTAAVVEHDVVLGAFSQVGPGAAIGGGSSVGPGSYLGLGCRIRDHVRIGQGVLVGMGAVVISDIPDGARVIGVPARKRGS